MWACETSTKLPFKLVFKIDGSTAILSIEHIRYGSGVTGVYDHAFGYISQQLIGSRVLVAGSGIHLSYIIDTLSCRAPINMTLNRGTMPQTYLVAGLKPAMPYTSSCDLYNLLLASPRVLWHIAPFHVLIAKTVFRSQPIPQIEACCVGCRIRTRNEGSTTAPGDRLYCSLCSSGLSCGREIWYSWGGDE